MGLTALWSGEGLEVDGTRTMDSVKDRCGARWAPEGGLVLRINRRIRGNVPQEWGRLDRKGWPPRLHRRRA